MALWRPISRAQRTKTKRSLRERGAAALEFALIAPLFFFVVFGGIELGFAFRSHLTLQDVSRSAARVASVERTDANADRAILERINSRADLLNGEIEHVIIFRAESLAAGLPASCANINTSVLDCSFYDGADIAGVVDGSIDVVDPATGGFAPANRGELGVIGVHIEYTYEYVTGFFDTRTMRATSVESIELNLDI